MEEINKPVDTKVAEPKLTLESVKNKSHLEVDVTGQFDEVLSKLSEKVGAVLQPRPEGFHITVIGPTESGKLKELTQEQLDKLSAINQKLQSGQGVHIDGMGTIDGATRTDLKDADKPKKTSYIAFSSPDIQEFRKSIGLPEKDLHITLGFMDQGVDEKGNSKRGDIHMKIVGKDDKGKDKLAPIDKKSDAALKDLFLQEFPKMHIKLGELGGPDKQQKQK